MQLSEIEGLSGMTSPTIAAFYAGLNALIILWLAIEVIRRRRSGAGSLGDGGDPVFGKIIRGHANAVETIPIAIVMLALAEMIGAPAIALHLIGVALTIGRLLHGLHFTGRGPFAFRPAGMVLTLSVMGLLALGLTLHSLANLF